VRWFKLLGWTAGLVLAREAYLALWARRRRRQAVFAAAQARARELGRTLIVLGAPGAGLVNVFAPDYGCGDLCIDLEGCPGCERAATGRAEDVLPFIPDDSAVVFVSCTLEYVDDVDLVWRELRRIAGDDVFAVAVEPWTLTAFFFPGAQRRLLSLPEPGERGGLSYRALPWTRSTSDVVTLARLPRRRRRR
jgi:hypothetical protein